MNSSVNLIICFLVVFVNSIKTHNKVLIIGGGPSGIAAATKLLANDVDVLVLEAEPRIGGRINSVRFGSGYADLGAEWCHGKQGNIVYELVKNYGILAEQDVNTKFVSSDRRNISEEFSHELHEVFDRVYRRNGERELEQGNTIGEYFIKNLNLVAREKYADNPENLHFTLMSSEAFAHDILTVEGAFSLFSPSANGDFRETSGHFYYHWNGNGYKTILEIMMGKLQKSSYSSRSAEAALGVDTNTDIGSRIVVNQRIENIAWNENGVTLTAWDGNEYRGDHVIFTPSLGVLKNHHAQLFQPGLSQVKQEAIEHLGFDGVMKILLEFSNPWWDTANFTGFTLVWEYSQRESCIVEYPFGPKINGRSWLLDLYTILPGSNNPNVLSLWFTGISIPEIEKSSDDIIIDGLLFVLEKFFGNRYSITKPTNMIRSTWYSNQNFHGSYSYQTLSAKKLKPSPNLILAKPLFDRNHAPRVLFAGEATHPKYYSTVHGAIETGYREAKRVLDYLSIQ